MRSQPHTEPDVPESLPHYVVEGVERQDDDALRELAQWDEELADYREQRPIKADEDEEIVEVEEDEGGTGTTVIKKVPCGKDCDGCPHGPYEYTVHREGKKLVWEYEGPA